MKLLQPKRPLRPRRKGRKRIPVKGLTGQEVKVGTTSYMLEMFSKKECGV